MELPQFVHKALIRETQQGRLNTSNRFRADPVADLARYGVRLIGRSKLGGSEVVQTIDELVSRSCSENTAHVQYSVRENSTMWRKIDGSADTWVQPKQNLESCVEYLPRPRPGGGRQTSAGVLSRH